MGHGFPPPNNLVISFEVRYPHNKNKIQKHRHITDNLRHIILLRGLHVINIYKLQSEYFVDSIRHAPSIKRSYKKTYKNFHQDSWTICFWEKVLISPSVYNLSSSFKCPFSKKISILQF